MNEKDNNIIDFGDDVERDIASDYAEDSHHDESAPHDEITGDTISESSDDSSFEEPAPAKVRKPREPHYVTRGALALALVLTMLISSVCGAIIATKFMSGSSSASESNGKESELTLAEATDSELTIAQIVDKNADAVVEITVAAAQQNIFGQTQLAEGAGSGVIVTKDGYIVTNYHVIEGATKVTVTLHNGEQYPANIVGSDQDNDIAIIKISADNLTVAELGDSSSVKVGNLAVAIGNPLGKLGGTATTGIVSALDRQLTIDGRTLTLMQTDAAVNPGNSGGGLFDGSGSLIGIVDAKSSGSGIEGLAFAIPINSIKDTINDLITTGKVSGKPVIGIVIQDVSEDNAQYYGLESAGVYISQVTGENAQRAGFQIGDRVVSIEGKEISSASDLVSRVREYKAGDTISVVVSRNGQQIEIKTVLEESTQTDK
ncbi:MAG: trypsin-like peptidase domain-containing protein [Bacillota bacterium]|nr:trypsin-like peptidase domain-containing protein [Bacillota bacterium]